MMWRVHRLNEVNGEFVFPCINVFSHMWEASQDPCFSVRCLGDVSQVTLSWGRRISPILLLLKWLN